MEDWSRQALVARGESAVLSAIHQYFQSANFIRLTPPTLTRATGACENLDTLFELPYFGTSLLLSQTGQLFLETLVSELGKVWCDGRSFRAEPRVDERHLTEFALVEFEFCGDFEELLKHIEALVVSTAAALDGSNELGSIVSPAVSRSLSQPFERVSYTEACSALGVTWGRDLGRQEETRLVERNGNRPLFVTHYPKAIKFFNMRSNEQDRLLVNSVDLLVPYGGEAVGAAEREFEYRVVRERLHASAMWEQLKKRGRERKDLAWYLNHVKSAAVKPHAGGGIGISRLMQFFLAESDIRKATPFPVNRRLVY